MTIVKGQFRGSYNMIRNDIPISFELEEIKKDKETNINYVFLETSETFSYNILYNRGFMFDQLKDDVIKTKEKLEKDLFFSLLALEHDAKIYIGKKEDIDKLYEKTKELLRIRDFQRLFDLNSLEECTNCFYQADLKDGLSLYHVVYEDYKNYTMFEKELERLGVLKNILFMFNSDEMFNSNCIYMDDWFYKNTSEEVIIAFYKTYQYNALINPNNELTSKSNIVKSIIHKNYLENILDKNDKNNNSHKEKI